MGEYSDFGRSSLAAKATDKFSRAPKSLMDKMVLDAAKQGKGTKIIDNLGERGQPFNIDIAK